MRAGWVVSDRESLIAAGLLPDPDGASALCVRSDFTPTMQPMVDVLMRGLEDLTHRVGASEVENRRWQEIFRDAQRSLAAQSMALDWLDETYTFDELALEVIAHARDRDDSD